MKNAQAIDQEFFTESRQAHGELLSENESLEEIYNSKDSFSLRDSLSKDSEKDQANQSHIEITDGILSDNASFNPKRGRPSDCYSFWGDLEFTFDDTTARHRFLLMDFYSFFKKADSIRYKDRGNPFLLFIEDHIRPFLIANNIRSNHCPAFISPLLWKPTPKSHWNIVNHSYADYWITATLCGNGQFHITLWVGILSNESIEYLAVESAEVLLQPSDDGDEYKQLRRSSKPRRWNLPAGKQAFGKNQKKQSILGWKNDLETTFCASTAG